MNRRVFLPYLIYWHATRFVLVTSFCKSQFSCEGISPGSAGGRRSRRWSRLCYSKSKFGNAFFGVFAALPGAGMLPLTEEGEDDEELDSDISERKKIASIS